MTGDADPNSRGTHRPVDAIAECYVEEFARAHPVAATMAGIAGHDGEMTDYSPVGFEGRAELLRRTLTDLEAAEPADERERVAKESMLERLGVELEMHEAGSPLCRINVIDSPLQETRQVFDLMPTDTEQDWQNIASRLALVPAALRGYRKTLSRARDNGRVSAIRQVRASAEQCSSWTRDDANFFAGLVSKADVPAGLQEALTTGASAAREAVADFGTFLESELAPHAPSRDAIGRECYALASRYFLGATVDLDETYAWGWQELARIRSDMQATANRIVPRASVEDAIAALDADAARRIDGKKAFRQWMQRLADRAIADLTDTHFDIPEPIRTIECCLAPTTDGGIYYTGPSEDFSRSGRMWWAVPEGVDSFSTWREVTTVFHEGVPGHHLQIAQTAYRSELLNRWQRLLCWVSGHGEGWALYSERLMDDLGYLSDPADRIGRLAAQAFRAVRVVVDIGMHLELEIPADNPVGFHPGERWTPDLGLAFMKAFSRIDDASSPLERMRASGASASSTSRASTERPWIWDLWVSTRSATPSPSSTGTARSGAGHRRRRSGSIQRPGDQRCTPAGRVDGSRAGGERDVHQPGQPAAQHRQILAGEAIGDHRIREPGHRLHAPSADTLGGPVVDAQPAPASRRSAEFSPVLSQRERDQGWSAGGAAEAQGSREVWHRVDRRQDLRSGGRGLDICGIGDVSEHQCPRQQER